MVLTLRAAWPWLLLSLYCLIGCSATPPASDPKPVPTTAAAATTVPSDNLRDGSAEHPLVLILLPAPGRSAGNLLGGMKPAFDAITASTSLHFEAKAADSYASVVEGMVTRKGDLAYMGPYIYLQAKKRGAAELLAVAVRSGHSYYDGAIFVRKDSGINAISDLKGKSVAFGDVNSTSSFNYPCAMMLNAGVDPSRDLAKVFLTGSHANSMAALAAGKVDASCAEITAYESAVKNGILDPTKFKIIAQTEHIPGSPIAMYPGLPAKTKQMLRDAFRDLAHNPNLGPNGLRGSDGRPLESFDTTITDADYERVADFTVKVTDDLKAAMLRKAATPQNAGRN
ncbi:MAG TPA: phosphate/phosphite/phosphonate ABC transporter substrate-binding protein [Chthonomonadaceae bacterium]|nr:phosphate/phosphite/phosphonate ABC transporter substrate-binding protein [Chthonomonadaceae bacterium]